MCWSDCLPRALPSAWVCPSLSSAIENSASVLQTAYQSCCPSYWPERPWTQKIGFFVLAFSSPALCPPAVYFVWCQLPTIRNNNQHLLFSLFCLHFQIRSRSGNDRPRCWVLQEQALDWKSNGEPLGSARPSAQHPPRIRYQQEMKYIMTWKGKTPIETAREASGDWESHRTATTSLLPGTESRKESSKSQWLAHNLGGLFRALQSKLSVRGVPNPRRSLPRYPCCNPVGSGE